MAYDRTDDQAMLSDAVAHFLKGRYDAATLIADRNRLEPGAIWQGLAVELGLPGLAVRQSAGGVGEGLFEVGMVLTELGRALVATPIMETAFVATAFFETLADSQIVLRQIAQGEARFALALIEPHGRGSPAFSSVVAKPDGNGWRLSGIKPSVAHAGSTTNWLVSAYTKERMPLLFFVEAGISGSRTIARNAYDATPVWDIHFSDAYLPESAVLAVEDEASASFEFLADHAILGLCAEGVGVLWTMMEMTLAYARERQQFNVPIASFQTLRHRIADMQMALVRAEAITEQALNKPESLTISAAKVEMAEASRIIGEGAVQIHGAMGLTDEMAVSHYFRRAISIAQLYGDEDYHIRRHAKLLAASA